MSDWTERPERIVTDLEAVRVDERRVVIFTVSMAAHAVLAVALVLSSLIEAPKADKDQPSLDFLFAEPVQPTPPPVPLDLVQPPPQPAPAPPPPPPTDAQSQPGPPAGPEPRPEPPPEPPPRPREAAPLMGWKGGGQERGPNELPPGPETGAHGEGAPGPRGEGMRGATGTESARRTEQPEQAPQPSGPATVPREGVDSPVDVGPGGRPRPLPPELGGLSQPRQRPGTDGRGSARTAPSGSALDFNVGGGGGFFGEMKFDDESYPWEEYATKIYFAIRKAWLRELMGRTARFERDQALNNLPDLDGRVRIHLVIHRDGTIDRIQVVDPSPMGALDDGSAAALKRVLLPPLPTDYPLDETGLTFTFELGGFQSAHQLRMKLEYERDAGEF